MPPKPTELMLTTAQLPPAFKHHVVVAHHDVGIGMGDAEGIHHLFAGLLLVIEDFRHDRRHALLQGRIGRAHQLFIVLDEIDTSRDQLADDLRRLMRPADRAPA
jgi:hypothetical protein